MGDVTYPAAPGYVDTDTSRAAAESVDAAGLRAKALDHLRRATDGLTSDELEQITGWPHQTASARLRELVLRGDAWDSPARRPTRHGRKAIVRLATGGAPTSSTHDDASTHGEGATP